MTLVASLSSVPDASNNTFLARTNNSLREIRLALNLVLNRLVHESSSDAESLKNLLPSPLVTDIQLLIAVLGIAK